MFYIFLILVAALGAAVYLMLFVSHVPGAKEERFGELEALPGNLYRWEEVSRDSQRVREERHLLEEGGVWRTTRLVKQVRFRDIRSGAVEDVLKDQVVKRRRIRP
ncbi:MAG: hypothetical protein MK135_06245 [Polyangiaceae bacterium]|nr:hypothetical protein [Polyangiaceae bacterium]